MRIILGGEKCCVCGEPATIYRLAGSPCGTSQWFCEEHHEQVNAMVRESQGESPIPVGSLQDLVRWIEFNDIEYTIAKLAEDILKNNDATVPVNETSMMEGWHCAHNQFKDKVNEILAEQQKAKAREGTCSCAIAKSKLHIWDMKDFVIFTSGYALMSIVGFSLTFLCADSYYTTHYYGGVGAELMLGMGLLSSVLTATAFVMVFVQGHKILKRIKEQKTEQSAASSIGVT
jgi:uncharacterized membrane protein